LGNFGASAITPDESWVTDAEFISRLVDANAGKALHPKGADGTVWAGRVRWSKPNALAVTTFSAAAKTATTGSSPPPAPRETEEAPWKTNRPIVEVSRQLYLDHPAPGVAAMASVQLVGSGKELREVRAIERVSDVGEKIRSRWSTDNGRTWSEFLDVQLSNNVKYGDTTVWEGEGASTYDPTAQRLVQFWLRQIERHGVFHNFTYVRHSSDLGRTWSEPQPLRYETGADFDPRQPLSPEFLNHNEAYPGSSILVRRDGSLLVCTAHANAVLDRHNDSRPWRMGSVLFHGRWDAQTQGYRWDPAARVEISPEHSARGLMEPELAELVDGRILVVWRGSTHGWDGTVAKLPGYKFFSLSTDGGRTLSPPKPWTYADGTPLYSASSFHRMLRHSATRRLYWFGNISLSPPAGNSPRYPLVVAEVDEETGLPLKGSVTLIDDRQPGQGDVQFSNFSIYEDRETHEFVLYLTTYGQEPRPEDWATADCIRYRLRIKPDATSCGSTTPAPTSSPATAMCSRLET
jgi:hypothetical protein